MTEANKLNNVWRDAYFYAKIHQAECPTFKAPHAYLSAIDVSSGQFILVIDQVEEAVRPLDLLMAQFHGKDVKEFGGPDYSVEKLMKDILE